ncbi:MAG TPA: YgiQ family radical SAM protein, partial [Sulfuricaulis sp.]
MQTAREIFSYRKFWAKRFGSAPFLPLSRAERDELGWDSCDIILITGDAYVDHPSFGMAIIGRVLEAQGFRVGIIAQPDWKSAEAFKALGRPNLFFGISAGNMDSMVNRYTADRKIRSDDAYTPGGMAGKRPDRSVIVYAQRAREAYGDVPVIVGGIEASLRRIAHYDYWSDKVRRSILLDAKADMLVYGNAERQVVEIAHRLATKEPIEKITDIRGTAFIRNGLPEGWTELDSAHLDTPGALNPPMNPYATEEEMRTSLQPGTVTEGERTASVNVVQFHRHTPKLDREKTVIRLPSFEKVASDRVLYAHASRVLHLETNPGNARALVQRHGERD